MLAARSPTCILLELPTDFADWIDYLGDPETVAPVAIAAAERSGELAFYPMADFSPELVAIRWGRKHNVPVIPFDLSVGSGWRNVLGSDSQGVFQRLKSAARSQLPEGQGVMDRLMRHLHCNDSGQLWERLVESPAMLGSHETIRTMSLLFGWAVRNNEHAIDARTLIREATMRQAVRDSKGSNSVALIGSFHAPALLPSLLDSTAKLDAELLTMLNRDHIGVGVSLVPYSFEQLDERSGYPAGIRDPIWHQRMVQANSAEEIDSISVSIIVSICKELRRRGFVASTPDATEAIRMMRDLATLRGLAIAGRGELMEALQSCLVQGELYGRGREVARAMELVLVGRVQGKVCSRVPRCGLAVSVESLLQSLGLPDKFASKAEARELKLDVLRSNKDRARAVVLRQLCAANIPYAKRTDTIEQGNRENLIESWDVAFQQGTSATIEAMSRYGVELAQVVEGVLQAAAKQDTQDEGSELGPAPTIVLQQLRIATECGLQERTRNWLDSLESHFEQLASLVELVEAATIVGRIAIGHVVGLPVSEEQAFAPMLRVFHYDKLAGLTASLLRVCLDRLEGLSGSEDPVDVVGLHELLGWFREDLSDQLASGEVGLYEVAMARLTTWSENTLRNGGQRMQGAAAGILSVLEVMPQSEFVSLSSGWVDSAVNTELRQRLRNTLSGALQILLARMQSDPSWLDGLEERIRSYSDEVFLTRLPALRGAFHEFSPADRERLLASKLETYSERETLMSSADSDSDQKDVTELYAILRQCDLEARQAVEAEMPDWVFGPQLNADPIANANRDETDVSQMHGIGMGDRWRMMLGVPPQSQSRASMAARSLDQLYGRGQGEGARNKLSNRPGSRSGGGTEAAQPTIAEWSDDLEELFGSQVCQEVLGESAAAGNLAAVEAIDPETVQPSIALLRNVLSIAGGLPEHRSEHLRKLAKQITEKLANQLAVRMRPALSGLTAPRPTRRRTRRLNLHRTIRDNLVNAYRREDGRSSILAKRLVFNASSKREMDWHLTFVVDVSGSMTESVVYSALCAAIFSELPALTVRFIAFSTEVIDLSGQVSDPLTLLLEVQVGGGTNIGLGLRHARAGIKVPSRSLVVLVSDFEEGVSVGQLLSEVRTLKEMGVKCIGLAALDDRGVARFHEGTAKLVASVGMPVAAVSPEKLADWVGQHIRGL